MVHAVVNDVDDVDDDGGVGAASRDAGLFSASLKSTLRAVGAEPGPKVTLDPAFFHRTLARWLGLPEGRTRVADPVQWSYRYWRAELRRDEENDVGVRKAYAASLSRTYDAAPEQVAWWIQTNDAGAIIAAGWLSDAPAVDVDDADIGDGNVVGPVIDDDVARRLFDDSALED
jgi:hypothetical protein